MFTHTIKFALDLDLNLIYNIIFHFELTIV